MELLLTAGDVAHGLVAAVRAVGVPVACPVFGDAVALVPALELVGRASRRVAQLVPFVQTVHLHNRTLISVLEKRRTHLAFLPRAVDLPITLPGKGNAEAGAATELLRLAGRDLFWEKMIDMWRLELDGSRWK